MPLGRRVARFNRLFANYFFGPVTTRTSSGFGTVHHRGRKSGREYRTPVRLYRDGDGYAITLPYGPQADWVKNVLAEGGCDLDVRGRVIRMTHPLLVPLEASRAVSRPTRFIMTKVMKSHVFLRLAVAQEPASIEARPAAYQRS